MDRADFERLRDMPGKVIRGDIRFSRSRNTAPLVRAENLRIENEAGVEMLLHISYNPIRGSKSLNVTVTGVGPVCRLDVDGPAHRPASGSHKHSLQTSHCPDRNLPDDVRDLPQLAGMSVRAVFDYFCALANIRLEGAFVEPDAEGTHDAA